MPSFCVQCDVILNDDIILCAWLICRQFAGTGPRLCAGSLASVEHRWRHWFLVRPHACVRTLTHAHSCTRTYARTSIRTYTQARSRAGPQAHTGLLLHTNTCIAEAYCHTQRERERERERGGERERERENSNSKTLFYKDCSLGSFKNLSNI